jgi:lipopolysaccharide/colanic/teichoic acid biosynthesis glycosyltransferase
MRATDHIGMMGHLKIGVILWDTREPGAKNYIKAIQSEKFARCVSKTTLYIYPTDNNDDNRPGIDEGLGNHLEMKPALKSSEGCLQGKPLEVLFIQELPPWKRMFDIAGAAAGLIVLSPLLIAVAVLIKLTSRGPVFFKQVRDGIGGKRFTIYKFRTMRADAERLKAQLRQYSEQDGPAFKLTNDPRVTWLGRYMRKSCIDELPQLWNVMKGDMTLVGPRPLDSKDSEKITGWGRRRLEVTPGLTCIWQVHGKSRVTFSEWMRMDIQYIKQKTLFRDLKLICETIVSVLRHRASV